MHYHFFYVLAGALFGLLFHWAYVNRKFKNDWRVVWSRSEEIHIIYPDYANQKGVEWVTIEIWFSRSRQHYKLDFLGGTNKCKSRQIYKEAIEKMNELNKFLK